MSGGTLVDLSTPDGTRFDVQVTPATADRVRDYCSTVRLRTGVRLSRAAASAALLELALDCLDIVSTPTRQADRADVLAALGVREAG